MLYSTQLMVLVVKHLGIYRWAHPNYPISPEPRSLAKLAVPISPDQLGSLEEI